MENNKRHIINGMGELIETLWNVNYKEKGKVYVLNEELIETLWNVNSSRKDTGKYPGTRINRNIVECK